jgi:uncharacterized protein (TIGR02996 family)
MNDEEAFLASVRAAPNDTALRLIYADWLDERADPRAALVRVEEEMRQLPVFSDRYWQLKPKRNALRAPAPAEWLEAMGYGRDCQPLFRHGFPEGWQYRWRLIREYTERWHRRTMPDIGGRAGEIRQTETELGRTLPPSLREWVAFAHDVRCSANYHDVLRDVYQMRELEGHSCVSLLLQCEGDYHWAVRHADFTSPDPPVNGFHWDYDNQDESTFVADGANPVAASITSFALGYVIAYTHGTGGGFGTDVPDSAQLIRQLDTAFAVRCRIDQMEIFERANIQVRLHHWPSREYITVELFKPMSREAVPAFLWDYTHNGGAFHGMFAPGVDQGGTTFVGR